jgi:hypothetical protein
MMRSFPGPLKSGLGSSLWASVPEPLPELRTSSRLARLDPLHQDLP